VHYSIAGVREAVFVNLVIVVGLISESCALVCARDARKWCGTYGSTILALLSGLSAAIRGPRVNTFVFLFVKGVLCGKTTKIDRSAVVFCALCFITDCFLFFLVSSVRISIQCYAMQLR
jgi:hypothetical protein